MDSSTVMWVIVGVVVVLVVIAAVVALARRASARKEGRNRERAGELREQAAATQAGIRRHQAEVDATEARARELRAEADVRDRRSTLHEHVQRRDEVLTEADQLDPDVETDSGGSDAGGSDSDGSDADEQVETARPTGQHRG